MTVKQFEYKPLSHYSYAIVSEGQMAVIDPERNPQQYYDFAKENNAEIVAVIETHPHADFVSSHLQIHQEKGATIYNSEKLGADYPHEKFDDGSSLTLGKITLKAINTPGHSPDSITIVATEGDETLLFTGDTLFIGDVGRPDLRENTGNMQSKREELAEMMFETMTHKFNDMPDDAIVYPTHGAGSLCGKNLSSDAQSTLGKERKTNWAFQDQTKEEFMSTLLEGQPMIPAYFGFNVNLNRKGSTVLDESLNQIESGKNDNFGGLIIDTRTEKDYKKGHLKGSINIQAVSATAKFETWLGAVVKPEEKFTLVVDTIENKDKLLQRIAKIGYESQVNEVIALPSEHLIKSDLLDIEDFKNNPDHYTIVDIRNQNEINDVKYFKNALEHPLNKLRDTFTEISTDKPIVVHCAAGYRSAIGLGILESNLNGVEIYDLSDAVEHFK